MLVSVMKLQASITTEGFKVPGGGKWEMMRFGDSLWSNLLCVQEEGSPDDRFTSRSWTLITKALWETHRETIGKFCLAFHRFFAERICRDLFYYYFFLSLRAAALLPWHPHSRVIGIKPSYIKSYQTLLRFSTVQSSTGSLPGVKDELSPMWWVWLLPIQKEAGGMS